MNISVVYTDATVQTAPLLVIGTWEGEQLAPLVANLIVADDWNGAFKKTLLLYPRGGISARRLLLVGLGKRAQITGERLSEAAAVAAGRARELKVERYIFDLPRTEQIEPAAAAQALAEGSLLGLYRFLQYR